MEDKMFIEIVIKSLAAIGVILIVLKLTKFMHNHSLGKYSSDKPAPKNFKGTFAPPPPPSKATQDRILMSQLINMVDDARKAHDILSEKMAWQHISDIAQEKIKKLEI